MTTIKRKPASSVNGSQQKKRHPVTTVNFNSSFFTPSNIFATQYLASSTSYRSQATNRSPLAFPFDFDTEYLSEDGAIDFRDCEPGALLSRMPVTYQIRACGGTDEDARIYASSDLQELATPDKPLRHPVISEDGDGEVVPFRYLAEFESVTYWRRDDEPEVDEAAHKSRPLFRLVSYAHFAIADIPLLATGAYQNDILHLFERNRLTMKRRLAVEGQQAQIALPWIARINGVEYRVCLQPVDSSAIHGVASYAKIAAAVGVETPAKDWAKSEPATGPKWITRMDEAYFEDPANFDAYALGDLRVSEILAKNAELMHQLQSDFGLEDYARVPRLTNGATDVDLFAGALGHYFKVPPVELEQSKGRETFLQRIVRDANTELLTKNFHKRSATLGKVDGGLCRNNNPITAHHTGDLYDIDLSGAYARAMSQLPYPCGQPVVEAWAVGISLKEWLHRRRRSLVPGVWIARISTTEPLTYEQDLFLSYLQARLPKVEKIADEDRYIAKLNVDAGDSKIFTTEIIDGILTDDLLHVVEKVWSSKQRNDFLSKVAVNSAIRYPRQDMEPDSVKWWKNANRSNLRDDDHNWHPIDFGQLIADKMLALRDKYKSEYGKKSPQQTLIKLLANTLYGVSVSRLFVSSNAVFANNITGAVRARMWTIEKGLNLVGTITDGQAFDLNRVLHKHPRSKSLATEKLTRLYNTSPRELARSNTLILAPLSPDLSQWTPGKDNAKIDAAAFSHLQTLYPSCRFFTGETRKLDLTQHDGVVRYTTGIGDVTFEGKHRITDLVSHGSANYWHHHPTDPEDQKVDTFKMRGYETYRKHFAVHLYEGDRLANTGDYTRESPAISFLRSLSGDLERLDILPPYYKWDMLKNEYGVRFKKWGNTNLMPGDMFPEGRLLTPLSLSQFRYRTNEQRKKWELSHSQLKRKYGYGLELYFLNHDGSLNYQKMLTTLNKMVSDGVVKPRTVLDKSRNFIRKYASDPRFEKVRRHWTTLQILKSTLTKIIELPVTGIREATREEALQLKYWY